MKLSFVLILLYGYLCHANDIWYQSDMSTTVVPPFQSVYTTLQQILINRLSTLDSNSLPTDESTLASITSMFYCEVDKMSKNLDSAVSASYNIRVKVDQKIASIKDEINAKEAEIARANHQIQDMNGKIQSKQSQIAAAEQSVQQAESAVNAAQDALRRAEKEVEDAKLCTGLFGLGRRKRFLGNFWNSVQNVVNQAGNAIGSAANTVGNAIGDAANTVGNAIVDNVVKPVCSVINFPQVDSAYRNVENKKNELVNRRNEVQTFRNDLNSMQNDLVTYNTQLYNLNYQLNQLKNSLISLPKEQHIILAIHQKLTNVVGTIRLAFIGSTSFLNSLATILNFNSVASPLNAVYDELQQNQFLGSFNIDKVTVQQIDQARTGLQALTAAMVNVPFDMANTRCSK